ncbi:MAG: HAD hydrolase-like protein [Candidatus Thiodiazotropha sp.]
MEDSLEPFEWVVNNLGAKKENCLVIGDSIRRDLGGAEAAGLDCVIVGGAQSDKALYCYPSLLAFQESHSRLNEVNK